MLNPPVDTPLQFWLLPHALRSRGEPSIRPVLAAALGCSELALPLARDPQGRPQLGAPFEHYDTGWSHSGEALLLTLGRDVIVGIDLEQLCPRPRWPELAERFFHPDEVRSLLATPASEQLPTFIRLWCAKEAVLKAHGQGISFGLEKLVFADSTQGLQLIACDPGLGTPSEWQLREWEPLLGYRAAVVWRESPL